MPTPLPYTGTDVFVYVLVLLGVVYAVLWWRDREQGMGAFSLAMMALAGWAGSFALHTPVGPHMPTNTWPLLLVLAVGFLCVGFVVYLPLTRGLRWKLLPVLLAPIVVVSVLQLGAALQWWMLTRAAFNMLITLDVLALAMLAFWCARREPGAGHALLSLALLTMPGLAIFNLVLNPHSSSLRQLGLFPVVLIGQTLLTVSLLRRRRTLEDEVQRRARAEEALTTLNNTLEVQVATRTEELSQMVDALDAFNRNVAHDLRGPVGSIAQLSRLADESLRRGDVSVALRMLPAITQQAEVSVSMMGALLSLARMSGTTPQLAPVALGPLVDEVVAQLKLADARLAPVEVSVGPLPDVEADAAMLRVALSNLLGNALKFSHKSPSPRVVVSASRAEDWVRLEVRDNGPGFDPAVAEGLFSPFVRLHGARYEGHGLGLTIVRRVIERHGGQVQAEGQPGEGACFSVSLPAAGFLKSADARYR